MAFTQNDKKLWTEALGIARRALQSDMRIDLNVAEEFFATVRDTGLLFDHLAESLTVTEDEDECNIYCRCTDCYNQK